MPTITQICKDEESLEMMLKKYMTREIKFKAWDGKVMSKPFFLDDAAYEGFPKPVVDENGECRIGANIVWLQWTGLTDKNGKDIYEGDVVGYWGNKTDGYITWRVLWDKNKASFRFGNDVTNFTLIELKKKEVIGNIYENKDLLK